MTRWATLLAVVTVLVPAGARAQGWHVEARAGVLDFMTDADALPSTTTVGVGVGYARGERWLQLTAGVPFGGEDPLWAAADAGARIGWSRAGLAAGFDVAAQGFVQRYARQLEQPGGLFTPPTVIEGTEHGYGVAGQVMPVVAYDRGRFFAQARAGVSRYHSTLGAQDATRGVRLAELQVGVRPGAAIQLLVDGRQYWAEEADYTFAGVTALVARGRASAWGSVGQWLAPDDVPVSWSVGGALALTNRLELTAGARRDAIDPLYGSLPRRSYSIGLRLGVGASAPSPAPVPSAYANGRATITLAAEDVAGAAGAPGTGDVAGVTGAPRVAGDFNGWKPAPMVRRGAEWTFTVALRPGVYEYAFVAADGTWFVPESTPGRRDDGMGGHVALLVVGTQP